MAILGPVGRSVGRPWNLDLDGCCWQAVWLSVYCSTVQNSLLLRLFLTAPNYQQFSYRMQSRPTMDNAPVALEGLTLRVALLQQTTMGTTATEGPCPL